MMKYYLRTFILMYGVPEPSIDTSVLYIRPHNMTTSLASCLSVCIRQEFMHDSTSFHHHALVFIFPCSRRISQHSFII